MSVILDALRRGRARTDSRRQPAAVRADAVPQPLEYPPGRAARRFPLTRGARRSLVEWIRSVGGARLRRPPAR